MNNNTPRAQGGHRERPLQKSMFLPDNQHPQQIIQQRQPIEQAHYHPMKRSSMPVLEGLHQNSLSPSYHYNNMSYSQNSSTNIPIPFTNEHRVQSQHQFLSNNPNNIKSLTSMVRTQQEQELRMFTKADKMASYDVNVYPNNSVTIQNLDNQYLITTIIDQLKQKHLPNLIKSIKKELTDDIFSLRQQFLTLKTEQKLQNQKQEAFNQQMKNQAGNIINFNNNNINNISTSKIKKEDADIKDLEREYFLLQKKYISIEAKLNENLSKIYHQFDNISQKLEHQEKSFKISPLKSKLPSIMLQYKESFILKLGSEMVSRHSAEEELTVSKFNYYIDRNGYLLDHQSRYLVDLKGNQIRLQEKHLKLLQQHKVLQR